MPIYEYICKNCGHQLDAMQKFSDAALRDCPNCNKPDLEKQISAPAFHLKGSGWYVTDFRNPAKTEAKKTEDKPQDKVAEKTPETPVKANHEEAKA